MHPPAPAAPARAAPESGARARRSAKAYPLEALMADCRDFFAVTGRRVTFEYTLMAGVNDSPAQARRLSFALRARWPRVRDCASPASRLFTRGCGGVAGLWSPGPRRARAAAARRRASWPRCWSATTCAATSTSSPGTRSPTAPSGGPRARPSPPSPRRGLPRSSQTTAPMKAPAHECPRVFRMEGLVALDWVTTTLDLYGATERGVSRRRAAPRRMRARITAPPAEGRRARRRCSGAACR
jgi:hypothetical protein